MGAGASADGSVMINPDQLIHLTPDQVLRQVFSGGGGGGITFLRGGGGGGGHHHHHHHHHHRLLQGGSTFNPFDSEGETDENDFGMRQGGQGMFALSSRQQDQEEMDLEDEEEEMTNDSTLDLYFCHPCGVSFHAQTLREEPEGPTVEVYTSGSDSDNERGSGDERKEQVEQPNESKESKESKDSNMALYSLMLQHPDNALACSAGVQAIHSLCHDPDHRRMLVNRGVIGTCLAAINQHGQNDGLEITAECMGALALISSANEDFEIRIARQGGICIILNALKDDVCGEAIKNQEDATKDAVLALRNIVPNDKQSASECLHTGGVEILLQVIRVYGETNHRVAKRSCRVLRALCEKMGDEGRRAIVANGGQDVIGRVVLMWESKNHHTAEEAGKLLSQL